MTWLWIGLGVWIGINILYFAVRYFVTSPERQPEESTSPLPFDASKRKNDMRFFFFG